MNQETKKLFQAVLSNAIRLAAINHAGQFRYNGDPYIFHPIRVMQKVDTVEAKIVAVLHDIVEDTDVTLADLKKELFDHLRDITDGYTQSYIGIIIRSIELLTKKGGESYDQYLEAVAKSKLAVRVKLADIEDNTDVLKMSVSKYARLPKYRDAYDFLSVILNSEADE